MMTIEPRNEPQMLRWFRKTYPSYDLQPLLLKRQRELEEARAFNAWLGERRLARRLRAWRSTTSPWRAPSRNSWERS